MGKEQELLEAARTGHLPAVEKLLSGKRLSSGFGGGGGGSGGGSGGGGGSSSHPLSSLLRNCHALQNLWLRWRKLSITFFWELGIFLSALQDLAFVV